MSATIEWDSPDDWKRLGERIVRARSALPGKMTAAKAALAAGVGVTTWRELETGKKTSVHRTTLTAVSNYLGWGPEGAFAILMGAEPEPTSEGDYLAEHIIELEGELGEIRERLAHLEQLMVRHLGAQEEPMPMSQVEL